MLLRYFVLLLAISLLLPGCEKQDEPAAVDIAAEKEAVDDVLVAYISSVENENMADYAQNIGHDPEMVNFGAFGEPIRGWDGLEVVMTNQNETLDNIQIEESDPRIHISPSGDLAWATSLWQFHATAGADTMNLPVRCTWVLQKQDEQWKIVHFHKSLPAG